MHVGGLLATDYAPYVSGIFALVGSTIGVSVAFQLARRAREEEDRIWLNDQRQAVYPKFVAAGQTVLDACEELHYGDVVRSVALDRLQTGYRELVVHNAVIQTLGGRSTIRAARRHMYTLIELRDLRLGRKPDPGAPSVDELLRGARRSRHQALIAMRHELGVPDTDGLENDLIDPMEPLRVGPPARDAQTS
jgi:hypothetical protein